MHAVAICQQRLRPGTRDRWLTRAWFGRRLSGGADRRGLSGAGRWLFCAGLRRRGLCVGGGVAANRLFREQIAEMCRRQSVELLIAPPELCTDNAAMAAIAWEYLDQGRTANLDVDVLPGLVRPKRK